MKKLLIYLFSASVLFNSCKSSDGDGDGSLTPAKGGKYYGGELRVNESEFFKNLFPHSIIDAVSYRIANQVYEGLLKFSPDESLNLISSLADHYEVDSSKTVYTFYIRKGVKFHDDKCFPDGKGREMTAEDIKYCFTLLCSQSVTNQGFSASFKGLLKGADEYYNATAGGNKPNFDIEGIKIVDNYTIKFTLTHPNSIFLYKLASPYTMIFPKEAYEKYGQELRKYAVGTGPFKLSTVEEGNAVILVRNENYWDKDADGNQISYLKGVQIRFIKDKKTEYLEFKKGNIDMMYRVPTDQMIDIEEESIKRKDLIAYELTQTPEMAAHYLTFLNSGNIFNNVNLRKAFSFAIDRKLILEKVLNGEGYFAGVYGVTPIDIFKGYDNKSIKGYTLNTDSARQYLRKAGYPDGKGLPKITLELNSDGSRNVLVAEEVKKQLKDNLGIDVTLNIVTTATLVEHMQTGKIDFFRVAVIADYPSPENFLMFYYGKSVPQDPNAVSYPNLARYKNPRFDAYYEKALSASTQEEALKYFLEAEKIVMADAPVVVLFYDEAWRLLNKQVKNFPQNAMQYRDYSIVYFEPLKKEKK